MVSKDGQVVVGMAEGVTLAERQLRDLDDIRLCPLLHV